MYSDTTTCTTSRVDAMKENTLVRIPYFEEEKKGRALPGINIDKSKI